MGFGIQEYRNTRIQDVTDADVTDADVTDADVTDADVSAAYHNIRLVSLSSCFLVFLSPCLLVSLSSSILTSTLTPESSVGIMHQLYKFYNRNSIICSTFWGVF